MAQLERSAFDAAGALLTEAMEGDPRFAGADAALAASYGLRFGQYWSANEADDQALLMRSSRAAIQPDPHHPRTLARLGHHTMLTGQRHDDAAVLLDRAVAAAPHDAEVLLWAAPTAAYVGRAAEAIARASRAIALSPVDPFRFRFVHFLSLAYYASNLGITAAALAVIGRVAEAGPPDAFPILAQPDFPLHWWDPALRAQLVIAEFGAK